VISGVQMGTRGDRKPVAGGAIKTTHLAVRACGGLRTCAARFLPLVAASAVIHIGGLQESWESWPLVGQLGSRADRTTSDPDSLRSPAGQPASGDTAHRVFGDGRADLVAEVQARLVGGDESADAGRPVAAKSEQQVGTGKYHAAVGWYPHGVRRPADGRRDEWDASLIVVHAVRDR
jgi:hypothetical protein